MPAMIRSLYEEVPVKLIPDWRPSDMAKWRSFFIMDPCRHGLRFRDCGDSECVIAWIMRS